MKILLIEDDIHLSNDIKHQLVHEGFEVETAYDGLLAERIAQRNKFDCILLDVNIPGKNGYDFAKSIRYRQINTPIIMLTAFGEIADKLQGFESGVDDYVTKPFYFKELLARIRVAIKRADNYTQEQEHITIEDLTIDTNKKMVNRGDVQIKLTAREFELLNLLAQAGGNPVSKKELISKVWGNAFEANTNTIEVFINLLRNKIDKNFEQKLIRTRVGFGYYLGKD
ncbi:MAG: response regulator transcription factor [Sphingobacteriales bacterium]|nr:MAG: response regulator transcription factor [Sphingobacteriales bacterium]